MFWTLVSATCGKGFWRGVLRSARTSRNARRPTPARQTQQNTPCPPRKRPSRCVISPPPSSAPPARSIADPARRRKSGGCARASFSPLKARDALPVPRTRPDFLSAPLSSPYRPRRRRRRLPPRPSSGSALPAVSAPRQPSIPARSPPPPRLPPRAAMMPPRATTTPPPRPPPRPSARPSSSPSLSSSR